MINYKVRKYSDKLSEVSDSLGNSVYVYTDEVDEILRWLETGDIISLCSNGAEGDKYITSFRVPPYHWSTDGVIEGPFYPGA